MQERKMLVRLWYDMDQPQRAWTVKTLVTVLNLAAPEIRAWRKDMESRRGYVEGVTDVTWLQEFLATERAGCLPGLKVCSPPGDGKAVPYVAGTWTETVAALNDALQRDGPFALSYGLQVSEADASRKELWAKLDVRIDDLKRDKLLGNRGANNLMNIYGSSQLTTLLRVGEVVAVPVNELRRRKGYGEGAWKELQKYLARVGLKPGMKPAEMMGWYNRFDRVL